MDIQKDEGGISTSANIIPLLVRNNGWSKSLHEQYSIKPEIVSSRFELPLEKVSGDEFLKILNDRTGLFELGYKYNPNQELILDHEYKLETEFRMLNLRKGEKRVALECKLTPITSYSDLNLKVGEPITFYINVHPSVSEFFILEESALIDVNNALNSINDSLIILVLFDWDQFLVLLEFILTDPVDTYDASNIAVLDNIITEQSLDGTPPSVSTLPVTENFEHSVVLEGIITNEGESGLLTAVNVLDASSIDSEENSTGPTAANQSDFGFEISTSEKFNQSQTSRLYINEDDSEKLVFADGIIYQSTYLENGTDSIKNDKLVISISLDELEAGTTYFIRAVATNGAGDGFGETRSFTLPSPNLPPTHSL